MKNIYRLFGVLDRWKPYYLLSGILLIIGTVIGMLEPKVLQIAIDGVVTFFINNGETTPTNDWVANALYNLLPAIRMDNLLFVLACTGGLFAGIAVARAGFRFAAAVITANSTEKAVKNLRDTLFTHIQAMPAAYFNETSSGDLIQRCTGDIDTIRGFIGQQVVQMISFTALFFGAFFMMYMVYPKAAYVSIALAPIILGTSVWFFKKEATLWKTHEAEQDKLTSIIQENLSGIRVVKAFANEGHENQKFDKQNDEKLKIGIKQVDLHTVFWPLSDFLVNAQIIIGVTAAGYFTLMQQLTIGEFAAFFTYSIMVAWPMRAVGRIMSQMGMAVVAMERIAQILDAEEENYEGSISTEQAILGEIEFKNVSFKYNKDEEIYALKNISFHIKKGEKIAFLGPTGSGKSTVIALLARFYEPDEGEILLDGQPLHLYHKKHLRSSLGIVHQKPFLFSTSIEANIAYTQPDAQKGIVYDVAKAATVDTFIDKMSKGYETQVGEKGVTLSGGQKQRVALARTLLSTPNILILDDATSAVDTETEYTIQQALKEKMAGKTSIIIAHRLTAVQDADRLFVFEKGEITESGKHDDLLTQNGFYKKVYDIQVAIEDDIL